MFSNKNICNCLCLKILYEINVTVLPYFPHSPVKLYGKWWYDFVMTFWKLKPLVNRLNLIVCLSQNVTSSINIKSWACRHTQTETQNNFKGDK
jgi:hypothetical protein